jgi:APA family basic amino acid/polyamine antiporter
MRVSEYCPLNPKRVFVREATGLVRQASWFDVFMFNSGQMLAGAAVAFPLAYYPYMGGDLFTIWLVATVFSVIVVMAYYLLSCAMPRTGADYVYASRILNPAIGFVAAGLIGLMVSVINVAYDASGWISTGVVPLLAYVSFATNTPSLSNLSVAISSPLPFFLLGVASVVGFGLLLSVGGFKRFLLLQNIVMVITEIGIVAAILVCLNTPHSEFVSLFDAVAKSYGTSYSDILAKSAASGWKSPPTTSAQALFMVPIMMSWTWFGIQSTSFAGEIKNIRKSSMLGMLLANIVLITMVMVTWAAGVNMIGYDFATAMANNAYNNPSAITIPALRSFPGVFYVGLASRNLALAVLVALAPMLNFLVCVGIQIVIFTRFIFAMSFDRALPERLSSIDERFHTPRNAVIVIVVCGIAVFGLTQLPAVFPSMASFTYYTGLMPNALMQSTFLITAFSLAAFPYLRRELYEQVFPFKRRIAGIPIATWVGTITIAIIVYTLDIWFLQPFSALVYGGFTWFGYVIIAYAVFMIIVYYGVKAYRARQGIDVSLAYKELPPE